MLPSGALNMNNKATIVDVRTREEFQGGHVANSINVPLQELGLRLQEIKNLPQPLILCCASGMRSASATSMLKSMGIACENGGSWFEVNAALQQS
jgi:phage shock protein E